MTMDAITVLERLRHLGVTIIARGDRLRLEPGSRITPDLLATLRELKPQVLAELDKERQDNFPGNAPKGYRLKYPEAQATTQELEEIADRVHTEGYVLLWSTVLEDLVAFYRDEQARKKIPPGFVPYSSRELRQLFGDKKPSLSRETLKLIHEAKKCGGRVMGSQPGAP